MTENQPNASRERYETGVDAVFAEYQKRAEIERARTGNDREALDWYIAACEQVRTTAVRFR